MSAEAKNDSGNASDAFVSRPDSVFHELTPEFKWEFTRRHPYYLEYWRFARRDYQPSKPREQYVQQLAPFILQLININGEPVDPATSFKELTNDGQEFLIGWKHGAASPISLQGYLSVLAHHLSPEARQQAITLLAGLGETSDGLQVEVTRALTRLTHPDFGACPSDVPILAFNLHAPAISTNQAVSHFLNQWRERQDITEGRRRLDKLPSYLEVWDRREGWQNDHYALGTERRLENIARELKIPRSTVCNQYKAAFRFIVGQEYSQELWLRLFLYPKLVDRLPSVLNARIWANLREASQSAATVSETTLQGAGAQENRQWVAENASINTAQHLIDLVLDIRSLRDAGNSREQIATKLELPAADLTQIMSLLELADSDAP